MTKYKKRAYHTKVAHLRKGLHICDSCMADQVVHAHDSNTDAPGVAGSSGSMEARTGRGQLLHLPTARPKGDAKRELYQKRGEREGDRAKRRARKGWRERERDGESERARERTPRRSVYAKRKIST